MIQIVKTIIHAFGYHAPVVIVQASEYPGLYFCKHCGSFIRNKKKILFLKQERPQAEEKD